MEKIKRTAVSGPLEEVGLRSRCMLGYALKGYVQFQDAKAAIVFRDHVKAYGIAMQGSCRVHDVILVRAPFIPVGGIELEGYPFAVLFNFHGPLLGKANVLSILHPVDTDTANLSGLVKTSHDPLRLAVLRSAGPPGHLLSAGPARLLAVPDCGDGVERRGVRGADR
jgi:hypothetical protein